MCWRAEVNGLGSCRYLSGRAETVFQIYPCQGSVPAGQVVRLSGARRLLGASGRLGRAWVGLGSVVREGLSRIVRRSRQRHASNRRTEKRRAEPLAPQEPDQCVCSEPPPDYLLAVAMKRMAGDATSGFPCDGEPLIA